MQVLFAPSLYGIEYIREIFYLFYCLEIFHFYSDDLADCQNPRGCRVITLKVVLIFPKNFLNFGSDMIEKQGIINL